MLMLATSVLGANTAQPTKRPANPVPGSGAAKQAGKRSARELLQATASAAQILRPMDQSGEIIRRRTLPDLVLTESLYEKGFHSANRRHSQHRLGLVLTGSYSVLFRNELYQVEETQGILLPAGELHTVRSSVGARCLHVELTQEWVERLAKWQRIKLEAPHTFQSCLLPSLVKRLHYELNAEDESSLLAVEGLAFELLAESLRCPPGQKEATTQSKIDQAKEFLEANFAASFTVAEAAESVGLHPRYLAALFRKTVRCTMKDYVRRLRVNFAASRLIDSDESLADIGIAAGFVDQSQFCRTFKYLIGMTPREYRARHQKGSPDPDPAQRYKANASALG
jgi:AraC-like DNA-binding protein